MKRRGQFRIIEALIAAILIIGSMAIAVNIQRIPRFWITYERENLEELAFNTLFNIADKVLLNMQLNSSSPWENDLFWVLNTMLPPTIYFNLTIYKITLQNETEITFERVNKTPITNIQAENINEIVESSSAMYVFTSRDGSVYLAILTLSRSKGG